MPLSSLSIVISLMGICLVLAGWLVNDCLAKQRDRKGREHSVHLAKENRKRDFRAFIISLQNTFRLESNERLVGAHKDSILNFSIQCDKIEPDISSVEDFKLARIAYISLTPADIECPDQNAKPPKPIDEFGNWTPGRVLGWKPPCSYEGRARIQKLLDTLKTVAK